MQVNMAGESGEMGVLASHVPSIEQLKPGLVEVIEEAGGSKQFFRAYYPALRQQRDGVKAGNIGAQMLTRWFWHGQCLAASRPCSLAA